MVAGFLCREARISEVVLVEVRRRRARDGGDQQRASVQIDGLPGLRRRSVADDVLEV